MEKPWACSTTVSGIQLQDSRQCLQTLRFCISSAQAQLRLVITSPLPLTRRQRRAAEGKDSAEKNGSRGKKPQERLRCQRLGRDL